MTTTLYRCYDEAGELLYVGISDDWRKRLRDHENDSPWFDRAETLTLQHWPDREAAIEAETLAIREERPCWNRIGSPSAQDARALYRDHGPVVHSYELPPHQQSRRTIRRGWLMYTASRRTSDSREAVVQT
jgi:predicted GIY-YIG superfamily endonuclease